MGTCLGCECETGRVDDDSFASKISLDPDSAVEVCCDNEHALKTVHVDG